MQVDFIPAHTEGLDCIISTVWFISCYHLFCYFGVEFDYWVELEGIIIRTISEFPHLFCGIQPRR